MLKRLLAPGWTARLRLWSGLVLFAYATMHLVNHAFGIRSIEAMDWASGVLLEPWQSPPGLVLLYGALLTHASLGFRSFYRRRHLRIPLLEKVQLTLGLMIPLLLMGHAAAIRYGEMVYGMRIGFDRVIYQLWVVVPGIGVPKQTLLMIVVWIHGCIGVRAWLRGKSWYAAGVPALTALATLVPVLAILGFVDAGLAMRDFVAAHPERIPPHVAEAPGTPQAGKVASVQRVVNDMTLAYLLLLGGVVTLRAGRRWHASRFNAVRLTYPGGRVVTVPSGFSVLEASRWAEIPHASVCGGRGRCSTCRIDIVAGGDSLPPPGADEQRLLKRIGAPPSVRLACQVRPTRDMAVVPLVQADTLSVGGQIGLPGGGRVERRVAALFIDLRQSTQLADDRLPYDALFIVERYIKAVSAAVQAQGGYVTNVAGDGVMSVFGAGPDDRAPALAAFRAALAVWEGVNALSAELGQELRQPLRFGMGLHVGVAVVGLRWEGGMDGSPFLGDTGNVAARLEAQSKVLGCVLVASREAMDLVRIGPEIPETLPVMVAGKQDALQVVTFADLDGLRGLIDGQNAA